MENKNDIKYAGFFTRLLATLVDVAVISFVINIIGSAVTLNAFVVLAIWWLYVSIMIIKWRATIGGKLFGIEVLKFDDLKPLSFKWASVRFFVSIAPFFLYVYLRGMQHVMDMPPSPTMSQLPQLIFILLPMIMFFTKKKQMIHDFVARSVVIDVNAQRNAEEAKQNKSVQVGQKILRVVGTLVFLTIFGYLLIYVSVFYKLGKSSSDRYNASFHTQYDTNDFNDSRIIFYNKELEKYSQEFVNADGMYDIFAADTKRDLALNCIQASLKEHNVSEWIEAGSNFRINARNKYALTEETMIKAKKNSNYMGQHFYDYDLNDVNDIENNIASIWDNNKNKNTCDKLVPASKLFDMFMVRYIPNREETLHSYQQSYTYAKPTGVPNKSFYKKEIDKIIQWLHTLHAKYPNIEQKIAELKIEKAKEAQKLREKKKKKAIERKIELTWLAAEENNLYTGGYYRNVDLNFRNDKGQTPLMLAIENGFIKVIEQFSKGKMDVSLKDNQGKTAFDYIKHATNNEERIESNMMYKALQLLEIKQIIKGKTYIKESSYDENKKIWRIKIKGSKCSTFTFPDYTECDVKKDAVNHPIFKAIKSKDNSSFDRLLTTVDINIKDPWNQSLLWIAMLYHNVYAVDKILENGVDINQSDNMNQSTPLKYALSKKDIELLKILIKYGVDTKSKDKEDIGKMKELLKEGSFFSAE